MLHHGHTRRHCAPDGVPPDYQTARLTGPANGRQLRRARKRHNEVSVVRRMVPRYSARMSKLLRALAAALLLTSCGAKTASPPVSADTWAVVDGHNITRQDVDKAYRRSQDPAQAITLSDEETLTAKLNVLNDLITQQILLEKAAQLKLDVVQGEIDTSYAESKKNIPDDAFQQELTRRGVTPAELRDALKGELLARKVLDKEVGSKVSVTDQEINDFFNANRA